MKVYFDGIIFDIDDPEIDCIIKKDCLVYFRHKDDDYETHTELHEEAVLLPDVKVKGERRTVGDVFELTHFYSQKKMLCCLVGTNNDRPIFYNDNDRHAEITNGELVFVGNFTEENYDNTRWYDLIRFYSLLRHFKKYKCKDDDEELKENLCRIEFGCLVEKDECVYYSDSGNDYCKYVQGIFCGSSVANVNAMALEMKRLGVTAHLTGRPMWRCMNQDCDSECIVECEEKPFSCVLGGGSQKFKKIGGK